MTPAGPRAPAAVERDGSSVRAGAAALVSLAVLLATSEWLAAGVFVPLASESALGYLLLTPPLTTLIRNIAVAGVLLTGGHALIRWGLGLSISWRWAEVRYLCPLFLVSANLASLPLLAPVWCGFWSPVAFVTTDLDPILIVWAFVWSVYRLDQTVGQRLSGWFRRFRGRLPALSRGDESLLADCTLAGVLLLVVLFSSPLIRFAPVAIGDEPKYLRHMENWWQGNGMDVTTVSPVNELPPGSTSQFGHNFQLLRTALATDYRQIKRDIKFIGDMKWDRRFNRAVYAGSWTVQGKNGGQYLMHGPGISVVLLPGYLIDRWLFDRGGSVFADDLFMTNLIMLTIYICLGVVVSWMIEGAGASRPLAMLIGMGTALSLPLAAFAFQFYPETFGALIVCLVARHLLAPSRLSALGSVSIGGALGWLGWLHVRFLPLSAVALAWFLWQHRREPRAILWSAGVYSVVIASLMFYVYHVTGSVLPNALYAAEGGREAFTSYWVLNGLIGFIFDRESGVLSLAPLYLMAPFGIGLMLIRRPIALLMLATLLLALFIPAAGHGYQSDGTTPLRHVLAVVPLVSIPVAEFFRYAQLTRRRWALTLGIAVVVLSVHHAVTYDLNNNKMITATIASSLSGWNTTLLFPLVQYAEISGSFDAIALTFWEVLVIALIMTGALAGRRTASLAPPNGVSPMTTVVGMAAVTAILGIAAVAAGGPAYERRLLTKPGEAARAVTKFKQSHTPWGTVGSPKGVMER